MNDVEVRSAEGVTLGTVHAAIVRRALKHQRAKLIDGVLYMPEGVNELPSFRPGEDKMTEHMTSDTIRTPFSGLLTEEHKSTRTIWVMNLGETIVSLSVRLPGGEFEYESVPPGPEPVCLTDRIPYDALVASTDFTRVMRRRPSILKMMTQSEVADFYRDRAVSKGLVTVDGTPDIEAAIEDAENRRRRDRLQSAGTSPIERDANGNVVFSPPKSALELAGVSTDGRQAAQSDPTVRDVKNEKIQPLPIHPRVATILAESAVGVPDRLSAEDTLRKFELLGDLSTRSLEEIRNTASYAAVKAWANKKLQSKE